MTLDVGSMAADGVELTWEKSPDSSNVSTLLAEQKEALAAHQGQKEREIKAGDVHMKNITVTSVKMLDGVREVGEPAALPDIDFDYGAALKVKVGELVTEPLRELFDAAKANAAEEEDNGVLSTVVSLFSGR